jgi:hypothetical protein
MGVPDDIVHVTVTATGTYPIRRSDARMMYGVDPADDDWAEQAIAFDLKQLADGDVGVDDVLGWVDAGVDIQLELG